MFHFNVLDYSAKWKTQEVQVDLNGALKNTLALVLAGGRGSRSYNRILCMALK